MSGSTLENAEKIVVFAASLSSIAKACSELSSDGQEATSINRLIDVMGKINFKNDKNTSLFKYSWDSITNCT